MHTTDGDGAPLHSWTQWQVVCCIQRGSHALLEQSGISSGVPDASPWPLHLAVQGSSYIWLLHKQNCVHNTGWHWMGHACSVGWSSHVLLLPEEGHPALLEQSGISSGSLMDAALAFPLLVS